MLIKLVSMNVNVSQDSRARANIVTTSTNANKVLAIAPPLMALLRLVISAITIKTALIIVAVINVNAKKDFTVIFATISMNVQKGLQIDAREFQAITFNRNNKKRNILTINLKTYPRKNSFVSPSSRMCEYHW